MIEDTPTTISTKIFIPQSDAANRYKAYVLIQEGREISKEQAVNELLAIGAHSVLPREVFKSLGLTVPKGAKANAA